MPHSYIRPQILFVATLLLILTQPLSAAVIDCKLPYVVSSGDTLSLIAQRAYGKASKHRLIYYINRSVLTSGPSIIRIGQKLTIPCANDSDEKTVAESNESTTANIVAESNESKTANDAAEPNESTTASDATESNDSTAASNATESNESTTAKGAADTKASENTSAESEPRSIAAPPLELLTGSDYAPFSHQDSPNGGLITEIVEAALKANNTPYTISWVNDWESHIEPLLTEKKYDAGFPWFNPGCPGDHNPRCNFLFSKPIFEVLIELFTRADSTFEFNKDEDIWGKILCRPVGYMVNDLNQNGRNWVSENKITLKRPLLVSDCFDMLVEGEVAGVIFNSFTGRESIAKQGLTDKVKAHEREISINALHFLVHKKHPRAAVIMKQINAGLDKIHASGQYDEIVNKHLLQYWETIDK